MSTKGSWQRPKDDNAWGSNFDRIFGKKAKTYTVTVPADLVGHGVVANTPASKAEELGSEPSAPATYINPETGE